MGAVKNWLMEMQDYASEVLDNFFYSNGEQSCRELFIHKYPGQVDIFNNTLAEWIAIEHGDDSGC